MSSEEGKCRWEKCNLYAVWGSEFCFEHRPTGGDAFTSSVCAVAKWAGKTAAGALLVHLLKILPHTGPFFSNHADLVTALNKPDLDDETLNRGISLLAQWESAQHASEAGQIKLEHVDLIEAPLSPRFVIREQGKVVVREREIEDVH